MSTSAGSRVAPDQCRALRAVVTVEGVQFCTGFGLAIWLLFGYYGRGGEAGGVLLLIYWALNLPMLGQEIALLARQYPSHRNVTLRLLEPLGARTQLPNWRVTRRWTCRRQMVVRRCHRGPELPAPEAWPSPWRAYSVRAAGHTILTGLISPLRRGVTWPSLGLQEPGSRVWWGRLLGWHRPATGAIRVDGSPLDSRGLAQMRRETAWVDPGVQLWNHSFLDNLSYGVPADISLPAGQVITLARLRSVIERLPDGLRTRLGEGGALISGGEGQRVRLGRAMRRPGVRLVILDEPCRGLDREHRCELLACARSLWREATLLCITHDVGETQAFDRVLVMAGGALSRMGLHQTWPSSRSHATARCCMPRRWCGRGSGRMAGGVGSGSTPDDCTKTMAGSTVMRNLSPLLWPMARLGEAMERLARQSGLSSPNGATPAPPQGLRQDDDGPATSGWRSPPAAWVWRSKRSMVPYPEVEWLVRGAGPALLRIPGAGEPRFLALLGGGRQVAVLGPDRRSITYGQTSSAQPCAEISKRRCWQLSTRCSTRLACQRGDASAHGRPSCASNSVPARSRAVGACVRHVARASGARRAAGACHTASSPSSACIRSNTSCGCSPGG